MRQGHAHTQMPTIDDLELTAHMANQQRGKPHHTKAIEGLQVNGRAGDSAQGSSELRVHTADAGLIAGVRPQHLLHAVQDLGEVLPIEPLAQVLEVLGRHTQTGNELPPVRPPSHGVVLVAAQRATRDLSHGASLDDDKRPVCQPGAPRPWAAEATKVPRSLLGTHGGPVPSRHPTTRRPKRWRRPSGCDRWTPRPLAS